MIFAFVVVVHAFLGLSFRAIWRKILVLKLVVPRVKKVIQTNISLSILYCIHYYKNEISDQRVYVATCHQISSWWLTSSSNRISNWNEGLLKNWVTIYLQIQTFYRDQNGLENNDRSWFSCYIMMITTENDLAIIRLNNILRITTECIFF